MYSMTLYRGAPFDETNLFTRSAVEGGKLVYGNATSFVQVDGGSLAQSVNYQNGGLLPKEGTATYVPNPDYNPNRN